MRQYRAGIEETAIEDFRVYVLGRGIRQGPNRGTPHGMGGFSHGGRRLGEFGKLGAKKQNTISRTYRNCRSFGNKYFRSISFVCLRLLDPECRSNLRTRLLYGFYGIPGDPRIVDVVFDLLKSSFNSAFVCDKNVAQ